MKNIVFLKDKIIAHRGYHDLKEGIPENSILAFKKAIRYKYVIELDVHILKDNTLVVFHDDNLKRVCGVDKNIDECTFDEIKDLKLFNTTCKIPLFKDVLKGTYLLSTKSPLQATILFTRIVSLCSKTITLFVSG